MRRKRLRYVAELLKTVTMSVAIFRVKGRGRFVDLDDQTRAHLTAALDEHDALMARFTPEHTFENDGLIWLHL